MAEAAKSSSSVPDKVGEIVKLRANGRGWDANRYADLALFVLMYNRVKNNRVKIQEDLTNPKSPYFVGDDTPEKKRNLENIKSWVGMSSITGDELSWIVRDNMDYFNKEYKLDMTKEDISRISNPDQFKTLYEFSRELSAAFGHEDRMLSVIEMSQVMEAKTNDCREKYEVYRKNIVNKGDYFYNPKEDKGNGLYYDDWENSERLFKQKTSESRRKGLKAALFGLLGLGGAAFTVTSFLTVLPFAGVTFGLAGAAGVVTGLLGTVAGGIVARLGLGGFFTRLGSWWKVHKDRHDFKLGLGKYKDNEKGMPLSKKGKEARYWNALYVKALFDNYRDFTYIQAAFRRDYAKQHFSGKKYEDLTPAEKDVVDKAFESKYKKYITVDKTGKKKIDKTGIEKEYLQSQKGVQFYQKGNVRHVFTKKDKQTFQGLEMLDTSLWEDIVNKYQVDAEGRAGTKADELYYGRFAKVRAKLINQPLEYATERMTTQTLAYLIRNACKEDDVEFEVLTQYVEELYDKEKDFCEKNNDTATFVELKGLLSGKLVDKFRKMMLDEQFTSTTISDIRQLISKSTKNQHLREILQDPGVGDNLDDVENILMWLDAEKDAGTKANGEEYVPFTSNIGVSIVNQSFAYGANARNVNFDRLINGAKQIDEAIESAHHSQIVELANKICDMETQEDADSLLVEIDSFGSTASEAAKICHFFKIQVDKKKEEVSYAKSSSIETAVGDATIANLLVRIMDESNPSDPVQVRNEIMNNTSITEEQRKSALEILRKQENAREIHDRNVIRSNVYDSVRANAYIGLQEKLTKIREFAESDPKKAKEIYEKIVYGETIDGEQDNVNDESIKSYLISKLQARVFIILKKEESDEKYNVTDANPSDKVMDNLKQMVIGLNQHVKNKTLTPMQRDILMQHYQKKIASAMDYYLRDAEKNILDPDKKYSESAVTMLRDSQFGGMGEFLNMNTPESKAAKERLERIREFSKRNYFVPGGHLGFGGFKYSKEKGSTEEQSIMRAYLRKNRPSGDALETVLSTINNIYESSVSVKDNSEALSELPDGVTLKKESDGTYTIVEPLDPSAIKPKKVNWIFRDKSREATVQPQESYMYNILKLLKDEFQAGASLGKDDAETLTDRLVALTVLKRKTIGMVLAQLNGYKARFDGDSSFTQFQAEMNMNSTIVANKWKPLTDTIDILIAKTKAALQVKADYSTKYERYTRGVTNNTSINMNAVLSPTKLSTALAAESLLEQ